MPKYKFSNKLMFALVMQDEEICAEFIQRLFPGKKVKSITFPNDIHITPEKTIVTGVLSKSVRLDVLFEGKAAGLEKGVAQEKREIAKNFKQSGIPIEVIAKNTGLTAGEVEKL